MHSYREYTIYDDALHAHVSVYCLTIIQYKQALAFCTISLEPYPI